MGFGLVSGLYLFLKLSGYKVVKKPLAGCLSPTCNISVLRLSEAACLNADGPGYEVLPLTKRRAGGLPYERSHTNQNKPDRPAKSKGRRRTPKKFGDMTEEDVMKLRLPDHLEHGLDILVIGINPGLMSAYRGHHYAGPNNHFWPCLFEAKLTPEQFTYHDDACCPAHGIGLTNIVERTTRGSSDLSRKEIKDGIEGLIRKIQQYKPLIACFNGKGIYEIFSGSKCKVGRQPECIPGTDAVAYVMPSTSARTMSYPRARDKVRFFVELKELRDALKSASGGCPKEQS